MEVNGYCVSAGQTTTLKQSSQCQRERERERTERDVNPNWEIRKRTYSPIIKPQKNYWGISLWKHNIPQTSKREKQHCMITAELALFTLFSTTSLTSKASYKSPLLRDWCITQEDQSTTCHSKIIGKCKRFDYRINLILVFNLLINLSKRLADK